MENIKLLLRHSTWGNCVCVRRAGFHFIAFCLRKLTSGWESRINDRPTNQLSDPLWWWNKLKVQNSFFTSGSDKNQVPQLTNLNYFSIQRRQTLFHHSSTSPNSTAGARLPAYPNERKYEFLMNSFSFLIFCQCFVNFFPSVRKAKKQIERRLLRYFFLIFGWTLVLDANEKKMRGKKENKKKRVEDFLKHFYGILIAKFTKPAAYTCRIDFYLRSCEFYPLPSTLSSLRSGYFKSTWINSFSSSIFKYDEKKWN